MPDRHHNWFFITTVFPIIATFVAALIVTALALAVAGLVIRLAGLAIQSIIVFALETVDLLVDWYNARTSSNKKV